MTENFGDEFQKKSKYYRGNLPEGGLNWSTKPDTFKNYRSAPTFPLPKPEVENGPSIWSVISKRRSIRSYKNLPLSQMEISHLFWACQGITHTESGFEFRAAPSAGALYPIETYIAVFNVEDIPPGSYHYSVRSHSLEQIQTGDLRRPLAQAALDQGFLSSAGAVFLWTGVFERSKWKYRQRAYRYVYIDTGHIAMNLALAATAIDLGTCQIAALYDDEVNTLLDIDGENESILYMSTVGKPQ